MGATSEAILVRPKLPRQIGYIIGNEGCERFSFYGMRNILTQFLVSSSLLFTAAESIHDDGPFLKGCCHYGVNCCSRSR